MTGHYGHRIASERLRQALVGDDETVARVPCKMPLSRAQLAVTALLAAGHSHAQIADRLGCGLSTVRFFIDEASRRVPGNLAAKVKLVMWYKGCPRHWLGPDLERD